MMTVSAALVEVLASLGVRYAFGVSGGAIASLWGALSVSQITVVHFRHESGAAFAAIEAHFVSDTPVVVFTTTGPGLTNVITGMLAARGEGAKIILISACTSAPQRGRWAIQQTDGDTMPAGLTTPGALFDMATIVESGDALPQIVRRLANGLSRSGRFVAHLSIPTNLQAAPFSAALPTARPAPPRADPEAALVARCTEMVATGSTALWLGFGARKAAPGIKRLAERLGAAVLCSPRAKGIFPEDHRLFVGVTGMGGHDSVATYMQQHKPAHILVLGTRLGEPTSFLRPDMVPSGGFIHVDTDPDVPGVAYPSATTLPVRADIGLFVEALLEQLSPQRSYPPQDQSPLGRPAPLRPQGVGRVRPLALMAAIQDIVIDKHGCLILAESGNAFAWATHSLRFRQPGQYRVSTGVGAMGHCACGVVGAALAKGQGIRRRAVALVGDGAMLMNNEISTAVKLGVPAIWIVLNDARYNMCEQGMAVLGMQADAGIPEVDFALLGRALGATGRVVDRESDLETALHAAMTAEGPYVLDVRIDATSLAPAMGRNRGLRAQGLGPQEVAFPIRPGVGREVDHGI